MEMKFSGAVLFTVASLFLTGASYSSSVEVKDEGFTPMFDGKSLNGWKGDPKYWRVQDGAITGEVKPDNLLQNNSFIVWQGGEPANFEMKGEYKVSAQGNSGINYRSIYADGIDFALIGYQADIDGQNLYTGQNYEERKRTTLAYIGDKVVTGNCGKDLHKYIRNNGWTCIQNSQRIDGSANAISNVKKDGWNSFHLVVVGNRMRHYVNGLLISDVTDNDESNRTVKGLIGMQVHVGPAMVIQYKNLRIKELK